MNVNPSQLRQLSPRTRPQEPAPGGSPKPPQRLEDRAEIGGSRSGLTYAAVAGLCLLAGSALVRAQVAPAPVQAQPVQEEVALSDQLQTEAQKQGVTLQFSMATEDEAARPITPWHAELILAEGGTVSVTESQAGAPERLATLTDTRQLLDYISYMRGDLPETAQQNGARVLRQALKLMPETRLLHPITQESLSPFTAAERLAHERSVLVKVEGLEIRLENLKQAQQWANPDPGCDLNHTYQENPGVWCLY